mmetsp:Transcript_36730/g.50991  ORF Transcript_36730/g.50991 Transcript_36730/m.50991 type:complete len:158 (+) Transcript_36730:158-631(+)|eukprot:CAMPEP_0196574216 /NCGR_PEP_ID=MMETSP1081-20130531/3975_1 /TAXON_ID=36882 /ORGANISM="Pyramimonas amylifera, Strain CCMP720" /LENGTH=157 /DNA_ID=CAMNT_0041892169 /DNA_START=118 /DNA_END=591 /DNA_ORIENTATION=+
MAFKSLIFSVCMLVTYGSVSGNAGEAITKLNFETKIIRSPQVWVLEFMSPKCGTCKELKPVFEFVAGKMKQHISFGTVNIDDPDAMQLAKNLGVMEEGIPNIKMFRMSDGKPTAVWTGWDVPSAKEIEHLIQKGLLSSDKDESGMYLKTKRETNSEF